MNTKRHTACRVASAYFADWRGVPHPILDGGYPRYPPLSAEWGTLIQTWDGVPPGPGIGYPPISRMGYPPPGPGMGYPPSRPGMGYSPQSGPGMGYPPRPEMGYPPDLRWGTPCPDLGWGTPPPQKVEQTHTCENITSCCTFYVCGW